MPPKSENELCTMILCSHLRGMSERLRQIPPDKWDWTFAPPAPTPRILGRHAYQWLVCDRQHITEPDISKHQPVPDPSADPDALCDRSGGGSLGADAARTTPEQWDAPRSQFLFGGPNVRWFVAHMVQNCIYKSGQLATLFFALGLDGTEPYDAPFPNPIYARSWAVLRDPLFRASMDGDVAALNAALDNGADANARDGENATALFWAAFEGHEEAVTVLLTHGADPKLVDNEGHCAADLARFGGHAALAERLTGE